MTAEIESADSGSFATANIRAFLIADVRGYTHFTVEHGDAAAAALAAAFAALAREVVTAHDGEVIELRGDEALAVFSSSRQALWAAAELQARFTSASLNRPDLPLRAGIGVDAGEAIPVEGGYRGAALNLAARLCSLAGPGEVLATHTVTNLARKLDGLEYVERGAVTLKGFDEPVAVVQVAPEKRETQPSEAAQAESTDTTITQHLPIGGFLGSLPANPLVARQAELERVYLAVDTVIGGQGRLVLLAGEPGAGKTRLAQEITLHLRNRDFLIATGSCFEPRQAVPYYPFLDALATLYGGVTPAIRAQVPQRWPYLARLLPEAGIPIPAPSDSHEEQERLFRTVAGFIQAVAEGAPVALLLDDLHWADAASLELLQHLARQTRGYRVFLLATYRDVEVGQQHPLQATLRDLHRQGLAERHLVRRLNREGTTALMAAVFDEEITEEFADLIYRHTDGNPFFTHEVLRALVERGDVYRSAQRWERLDVEEMEVPESVRSTIGERLSHLSEPAQEILHEASILGQTFAFDELLEVGKREEEDLEAALAEAEEAGLVRDAGKDRYAFNHALTQQTLYAEIPPRRKRRLHLAAGGTLERLPERKREDRTAELAWHFLQADDAERAIRYALQAGERAETVAAWDDARQQYRTALELVLESGDEAAEADAAFRLGRALAIIGEHDQALASLDRAARLFEALGDRVQQMGALVEAGWLQGQIGQIVEAQAAIEAVEGLLTKIEGAPPTAVFAGACVTMSLLYLLRGRYEEQAAIAERGALAAAAAGDERMLTRCERQRVIALGILGRSAESAALVETLIPRAEAVNDLVGAAQLYDLAGEITLQRGDLERSRELRRRAASQSQRLGGAFEPGFTLSNLAQVEIHTGEWEASREHCAASLKIGEAAGNSWVIKYASLIQGDLSVWAGDHDGAIPALERCLGMATEENDLQAIRLANLSLARIDISRGNPQSAIARLEQLGDRGNRQEINVTEILPVLATAYLENGDVESAERTARESVERADPELRLLRSPALCVLGTILGRTGRRQEAEACFEEALSVARSMPHLYYTAETLYQWGLMLGPKDDAGAERLHEALRIFEGLGALRDVEQAQLALNGVD